MPASNSIECPRFFYAALRAVQIFESKLVRDVVLKLLKSLFTLGRRSSGILLRQLRGAMAQAAVPIMATAEEAEMIAYMRKQRAAREASSPTASATAIATAGAGAPSTAKGSEDISPPVSPIDESAAPRAAVADGSDEVGALLEDDDLLAELLSDVTAAPAPPAAARSVTIGATVTRDIPSCGAAARSQPRRGAFIRAQPSAAAPGAAWGASGQQRAAQRLPGERDDVETSSKLRLMEGTRELGLAEMRALTAAHPYRGFLAVQSHVHDDDGIGLSEQPWCTIGVVRSAMMCFVIWRSLTDAPGR
jgi:hypothetical protein